MSLCVRVVGESGDDGEGVSRGMGEGVDGVNESVPLYVRLITFYLLSISPSHYLKIYSSPTYTHIHGH